MAAAPALAVGVDLGGTKVLVRALAEDGVQVVAETRRATPRGADAIVEVIADAVAEVAETARGAGAPPLGAVGVGAAGLVDAGGVLRSAPNLPGVSEEPLRARLEQLLAVEVEVGNDATVAALAEHRVGAGQGVDDLVLVTLGTGIGAGIVAQGQLLLGANGFAGEPGHMVISPDGPPCPCGRRGCWERFASGSGLGRLARDAAAAGRLGAVVDLAGGDPDDVRGEHVGRAAADGDPGALAVLDDFAWWVAAGIANLVNVLDPSVVLVGGGLAELGDLLLQPVRRAYDGLVLAPRHRPPVRIAAAALGADAGVIGAWLLARDRLAAAA